MAIERGGRTRAALGTIGFAAALWIGAALAAPPAVAQPPLLREEFDLDDGGWVAADGDSSLAWDALDADDCAPDSGSALATHGGATAGAGRNFVPPGCISPITALATYSFGARVRFPAAQARTGSAQLVVVWDDGPACNGSVTGSAASPDVTTSTAGTWVATANLAAVPPVGTQSASLRVRIEKNEAGGELDMHFDRVFVARGRLLFVDDLEAGSACRWSLEVP